MRNTDRLGISTPHLMEAHGLTWVLHRQVITASRWPALGQAVTVFTVPTRTERDLITYRDFYLLDEAGRPIITSTSAWVVMSLESRRVRPLPEPIKALLHDLPPPEQHLPWPDRKTPTPKSVDRSLNFRVGFAQLDFNNHLTNPAFAELMVEPLGADYLTAHLPRRADISYHHEARYGQELLASVTETGPESFEHVLQRDGEVLATMASEWEAR